MTNFAPKQVWYHIYTAAGAVIRTWPDVMSMPKFTSKLFGGLSSETIQVPRQWNSLGEPGEVGSLNDMSLGNIIEQRVVDRDGEVVIYRGTIMDYKVDIEQAVTELTVMSKQTLLFDRMVLDVSFTATDPSDMMRYFVDGFPNAFVGSDGDFEVNTGIWTPAGANTIARSTAQHHSGAASMQCTFGNAPGGDPNVYAIAGGSLPVLPAGLHTFSVWIWIPLAYDGNDVYIWWAFNAARGHADMNKRDQWQQVSVTFTSTGAEQGPVISLPAATNGGSIFVDDLRVAPGGGYLPGVTWDGSNPLVGFPWDISFKNQRLDTVFETIVHLAGGFWYWRLNPDDSLTFNSWNRSQADLTFTIGIEVSGSVVYERSNLDRKKRVILYGDTGILAEVASIGYDPAVLPMDMFISYPRVAESSLANRIAHSLLEWSDQEAISTEMVVLDNNFDTHGMDIESLRCGMSVSLLNPLAVLEIPKWGDGSVYADGTIWGGTEQAQVQRPLVIASIDYEFTYARIKLTNRPIAVPEEMYNLSDRLLLAATRS